MSKIPIRATPHLPWLLVEDLSRAPWVGEGSNAGDVAKRTLRNRKLILDLNNLTSIRKDRVEDRLGLLRCPCPAVCKVSALPQSRRMPQTRQFPLSTGASGLRASDSYSTARVGFPFGEQLAIHRGMLRITLPTAARPGLFVLEGKLTGLWAAELVRVARKREDVSDSIFDLEAVFPVDSAGEEALRKLSGFGAKFTAESVYGKDLCKRLKLHRVAASNGDNEKRRSGSPLATPNDHRAHLAQVASYASAASSQHCAGSGK